MKNFLTILIAGAMLAPAAFAAGNDNGSEARFRMKYGRPSPQEEARTATPAPSGARNSTVKILAALPAYQDAEERFKAKHGRFSPQQEARLLAAQKAVNAQKIIVNSAMVAALPARQDAEERFKAKYGRPSPQQEARMLAARQVPEAKLMATESHCGMSQCCKRHS